jgi:hypothetical protein
VLEKCGFTNPVRGPDEVLGTAWRFRLERA